MKKFEAKIITDDNEVKGNRLFNNEFIRRRNYIKNFLC